MRLEVVDLAYGGAGVARTPEGVVFIPGAFPGEVVEATLTLRKKRFARARLEALLEPSPHRIRPETVVVPGMPYAELAYAAEVAAKQHQLEALLTRIGRLPVGDFLQAPVAAPLTAHYRNKLTLHWDGRTLGYVGEDNRTLVDTPHCPLSQGPINEALAHLRANPAPLRKLRPGARVFFRHTPHDGTRIGFGAPPTGSLTEQIAGLTLTVAADAFFQVNPPATELLLNDFRRALGGTRRVVDLYCGCGLFGLVATQAGATDLFGLEVTPSAIASAKANARHLGVQADYRCAPAETLPDNLPPADCWILDPPREGLSERLRAALMRHLPPRIAYISCGPDTLARDLLALAPHYVIDQMRLFDFFPRTAHFETLTLLSRR